MKKYTVLGLTMVAAMIASVAVADIVLSHGQVVKTGPATKTISSFTECGATVSRAERAPAGGVRTITYKVCPHVNLLAAGSCPMNAGCGAACAAK